LISYFKSLRQLSYCTEQALQPRINPSLHNSISPDIHALPSHYFSFLMQARLLHISTPLIQRSIARSTSTQLKVQFKLQHTSYKRQYTMAQAMHGHSAACCSIPPIISKGYEPKGKYETIGGLKTCKFCSILAELILYLLL
jgi:hypothetical protein